MTTKYYRPSYINVDLDAISHNFNAVQRLHPHKTVIAVVKANAYGLGAVQVAGHLMDNGAEFFAVATLDEAIELRMHGIKAKLLILGIIEPEDINKALRHRVALTVPGIDWLNEALSYLKEDSDKSLWLHVKVDTGMNRIGIRDVEEYRAVTEVVRQHPGLVFEGVFTHFSSADVDNSLTAEAYDRFLAVISEDRPEFIHCQNSAAALRYDMSECTALRFGISMYGYYPSPFIQEQAPLKLKPAMQLVSTVNFVKELAAGDSVSYGAVYTAAADAKVATLPLGYADGFLRSMEGYAVNINGADCRIVGRICMDQLMVVVDDSVRVGDKAILIHNKRKSGQSLEQAAEQQQSINYEVLCNLSRRLPRIYHTSGEQTVYNELLK
ncbi:alanine racemase [Macrococcus equipercicus]|uniref:Alanine racemase n=1 Tax=Macrococcus equipercicus TaxID=69967 RepID=A0A9Q9BPY3_9STAP|nr:alanine racemase [Macrococcus equipercicus]UTH13516.1 alanine racemase [Macrococcus equipercicus]